MQTVLLMVSTLARCGPVNVIKGIVRCFDPIRYRAIVATLSPEPADSCLEEFHALGVPIRQLNLSRIGSFLHGTGVIQKLVQEINPDVVHLHGPRPDLLAAKATTRCPVISTIHCELRSDYRMHYGRRLGAMLANREYAALKRLNSVVAVSEGVAKAASTAGVSAHVICNGIDTGVYACAPARDQTLAKRMRMGRNSSAIVVLHTGCLIERKRPLEVIQAFMASSLFQRGLLVFAGKGPLYSQCRQKAAGAHNILFLGQREDVPDLLKSADILVSHSCAEGLPMALLEGCATGVRVIATCIGPHEKIRQIFPEQVTLYSGGVAGLKTALDRVSLSGAQQPIVPSAESLEAISDHRMSRQYQRFYDSLLGIRREEQVAISTHR